MYQQRDALTELMMLHVGEGRRMTTREFAASAVDPQSSWAPSKSLVGNIITGKGFKVTPQLVSAITVGLGLDRQIVATAAHFQAIGYTEQELQAGAADELLQIIDP
ncbi:hypothetical protein GCM10010293_41240 [Streptomyces griseoflavus]|uniref:hypothetical protein n=1 Tax=Streptomyces griseoflavus TaxID=35619 RepID=UPI0019BC374D|nr:hypothetical protein [Streptomyces griseoflavus]GGV37425.1 hypothetical protein GCM10010293_41240 [Streptomyces griseoflavus]